MTTSTEDDNKTRDHVNQALISAKSSAGGWLRAIGLSALQRRIFLVAVASLLPIAILSCATLVVTALDQKERLLRANVDTMSALMTAVDADLTSTIAALEALSASSRLAADDLPGLHRELRELLERREDWLNVSVSNPDATPVLNARVEYGAALPSQTDPHSTEQAVRTGTPVIGNVAFNPLLQRHAFSVRVPYLRDGKVHYVISAVIRPEFMLHLVESQRVEGGGLIGIFDRNLNAVARSLNHDDWVGKPASEGLLALLRTERQSGWTTARTLEGAPVYSIFYRSAFSGWSAAVGVPQGVIDGPFRWSIVAFGSSIVISVMLGLIAALLVGRTIVRPMHELEHSAELVGRGEWPSVPASSLPEIRRVAVALAAAHAERERLFLRERSARVAAEEASKAKDEFLAMLGHELRNPLAAISTAAQVLDRNHASLDPAVGKATAIIGRQAKHLAHLTDDLLDAGRVLLGKIALRRTPIDFASAVQMAIDGLRAEGRLANHHLETHLEPVWISADVTRIDQVIANLLTNALKYTPSGGTVDIHVSRRGNQAILEVRDTGIGMDQDLLTRVFDLFVQGERALDRSQGGLGIGLTLVRRLTELHDGTVEAHSEGHGRGSTFVVRLQAIEPPAQSSANPDLRSTRSIDIALIEDNEDARLSMRLLLEIDGHRVWEASDGRTGIELVRAHPNIQIAFVDIGLPELDGYAVASAIRGLRGSGIRLIAMSGYGSDVDRSRGVAAGFDRYLVKPIDQTQLIRAIAEAAAS